MLLFHHTDTVFAADQKKMELVDKYKALKDGGQLENFMKSKRKHRAAKVGDYACDWYRVCR